MRTVVAIAMTELRRFLADRSNLFFVLIFPLALVAVVGLQFGSGGGGGGRVSLVGAESPLRTALVQEWEGADLTVADATDVEGMQQAVARGQAQVGIVLTPAAEEAYADGAALPLEMIQGSGTGVPAVAEVVRTGAETVGTVSSQQAALAAAGVGGGDGAAVASALEQARADVPRPTLTVAEPEDPLAQEFAGLTQFGQGAASQLLLFVFLNTLAAATTLIQARRNGVVRRMVAAPVSPTQTLLGLTGGRLVIALFQGVYIMVASSLLFGVEHAPGTRPARTGDTSCTHRGQAVHRITAIVASGSRGRDRWLLSSGPRRCGRGGAAGRRAGRALLPRIRSRRAGATRRSDVQALPEAARHGCGAGSGARRRRR